MARLPEKPIVLGPYSTAHRVSSGRGRRRVLAGLLVVAALLVAGAIGWHVLEPRLSSQVATIPTIVVRSLHQHHATFTASSAIPLRMARAEVAIEDRRFYSQHGIDVRGLARAAYYDITHLTTAQGGATIEMQLVERTLHPSGNALLRALDILGLAWVCDDHFSKSQIIDLYLNDAYFGRGAYGVAAAAHAYFGVALPQLTLAQAAFLAALPQAPSIYGAHPTASSVMARWRAVLSAMASAHFLTPAADARARHHPPAVLSVPVHHG